MPYGVPALQPMVWVDLQKPGSAHSLFSDEPMDFTDCSIELNVKKGIYK